MLSPGIIISDAWRIVSFLGEGACAKVYNVVSVLDANYDREFVLKAISLPKGSKSSKTYKDQERVCNTLFYEYTLYAQLLYHFPKRPELPPTKFYGEDNNHSIRYLVLEKLDEDLLNLAKRVDMVNKRRIGELGLQILEGLQYIHGRNYVYVDVKPDNFMLKGNNLYFIDFGLMQSCPKENSTPKVTIDYTNKNTSVEVAGTPTFVSLAAHFGGVHDRKDDIEAMAYVLISLFNEGKLPWSNAKSALECRNMKRDYPLQNFSNDYDCSQLVQIIEECRQMEIFDAPNYDRLRTLLQEFRDSHELVRASVKKATTVTSRKKKESTHSEDKEIKEKKPSASSSSSRPNITTTSSNQQRPKRSAAATAATVINLAHLSVEEKLNSNRSIHDMSNVSTSSKLSEIIDIATNNAKKRAISASRAAVSSSNELNQEVIANGDDDDVFSTIKTSKVRRNSKDTVGNLNDIECSRKPASKKAKKPQAQETVLKDEHRPFSDDTYRYTLRSGKSFNK